MNTHSDDFELKFKYCGIFSTHKIKSQNSGFSFLFFEFQSHRTQEIPSLLIYQRNNFSSHLFSLFSHSRQDVGKL